MLNSRIEADGYLRIEVENITRLTKLLNERKEELWRRIKLQTGIRDVLEDMDTYTREIERSSSKIRELSKELSEIKTPQRRNTQIGIIIGGVDHGR